MLTGINQKHRIDKFIKSFKNRHNKAHKRKKKRYPRDESLYNLGQENEFLLFMKWMPVSAMYVSLRYDRYSGRGRPLYYSLYDILVCLSIQRYFHLSLRRSMGVIKFIVNKSKLNVKIPCFKLLNTYMNSSEIDYYTNEIIEFTSKPTRLIEHFFATDSTGVATFCFSTWFMIRMSKKIRRRDHVSVHVTTGTKTNIITAVDVDCKKGKDGLYLREHVNATAKNFKIEQWSGDSTYASKENCKEVCKHGAKPYFKLRRHFSTRKRGNPEWESMIDNAIQNEEEYNKNYHRRSNVESTISAKTRKFGSFVRSRNDTSRENEDLLGWVCYNFSALSRAYYQYKEILNFN